MAKEIRCSFCGRVIKERLFVQIYSIGDTGELKECDDCIREFIEHMHENKRLMFK